MEKKSKIRKSKINKEFTGLNFNNYPIFVE